MAMVRPITIGQALYWAYSNLVMFFAAKAHEGEKYQTIDYVIRNKTYGQLQRGEIQIGSLLVDEKHKMVLSDRCCYCYETGVLVLKQARFSRLLGKFC